MRVSDGESKKYLETQLLSLQTDDKVSDLKITNNTAAMERGSVVVASGKLDLNGTGIDVHIGLDSNFPNSLPIILVEKGAISGYIPHVEKDGYVCYFEKESLVIDPSAPERILIEAVQRTEAVLKAGISGKNQADFLDEFDAYWRSYQETVQIQSLVSPTDNVKKIVVARSADKSREVPINYVADSDSTATSFGIDLKTITHENGIYLPLQLHASVDVFSKKDLSVKDIRKYATENITQRNRKLLNNLTKKHKRDEVIVFGLPRPSGGYVLFGVLFQGVRGDHPLNNGGQAERVVPLTLLRMDKTHLLPRGGANDLFQDKSVALVGCGAIGGHIAIQLAQSGLFNLTLVDDDFISPDNIFRHVLGKEYLGKHKADALKTELENKFPYMNVKAFSVKINEVLSKAMIDLDKFDLIIMATGDDNLSLKVNEFILAKVAELPILYTWLEPYGIGGHVLITNIERAGCFQCLFTPVDQDGQFSNRASFVAPGQTFTKDISGCANRFTPFSSLDASTTATLATRMACKVLTGKIPSNALFSWKGESDQLTEAGFYVSERYRHFEITQASKGVEVCNPSCSICGEKRA